MLSDVGPLKMLVKNVNICYIKFSRDRFFLFGPGRARREQPNAGLHLGVRAFVRSVSHIKVFLLVYLDFFLKQGVCVPRWAGSQRARNSPSATIPTRGLAVVSAPSPMGPLDDGTTAAAELTVPPAIEVRMWPDACIDAQVWR